MTISLDGFVADQNGHAGRLYPDLAALRYTTYMKDAIEQTGAVLMGRRTFEMGDPDSYVGNYEFQVPIFVLTHHPPSVAPKQDEHLTFTFVTGGVESAVSQARAAARDKAVQVVGGVSIAQQLLDAGLVDELHVDIMPVFLGTGLRSFESSSLERARLEKSACRKSAREQASDSASSSSRPSGLTSRNAVRTQSLEQARHLTGVNKFLGLTCVAA
jgi:dihydrofolate reductase